MPLELQNLSKQFSMRSSAGVVSVLDGLSFSVDDGRFISIIGPSGCGKTTLLRIIAGLERVSEGKVLLDGRQIIECPEKVAFVFQEYALFPWRTSLRNIEMGLEIMGISRSERRMQAMQYIRDFDLEGFEDLYPRELSGGMKQRVAIARALILKPRVILMDEPFGSLDSQTRNAMQAFLFRVWTSRKETILFVTHNVDEAVYLSDQIVVLSKRPAKIMEVFDVPLERPRDRTSPEFNEIRKGVLRMINGNHDAYQGSEN